MATEGIYPDRYFRRNGTLGTHRVDVAQQSRRQIFGLWSEGTVQGIWEAYGRLIERAPIRYSSYYFEKIAGSCNEFRLLAFTTGTLERA